jgi:stage V sporulation protein B
MRGFLLIMLASNLLTSGLNVCRLIKVTGADCRIGRWVAAPTLAAAAAVTAAMPLTRLLVSQPLWQAVCVGITVAAVYLLLICLAGCTEGVTAAAKSH